MMMSPLLAYGLPFIIFLAIMFIIVIPIIKRCKNKTVTNLLVAPIILISGVAISFYAINLLPVIVLDQEQDQYQEYMILGSTSFTLNNEITITISKKSLPEEIETIVINNSSRTFYYQQILYTLGMGTPLDSLLNTQQKEPQIIAPYTSFQSPHRDIFILREPSQGISSKEGLEKRGWIYDSEEAL